MPRFFLACILLAASVAQAQYPERPVTDAEMKAILWDEYRSYTPILRRIGLLKD